MKQLKGCFDKMEISSRKTLRSGSRNNAYSRQNLLNHEHSKQRLKTQSVRPVTLSLLRKTESSLDKVKGKNSSVNKMIRKSNDLNTEGNSYEHSKSVYHSKSISRSQSHFVSVNEESNINSRNPTKPLSRVDSSKTKSNREELRRIIDSIKRRDNTKGGKDKTYQKQKQRYPQKDKSRYTQKQREQSRDRDKDKERERSKAKQKERERDREDILKRNNLSKSIGIRRKQSDNSQFKNIKVQLAKNIQLKYAYRSEQGILASNPNKTNQDSLLIKSKFSGDNYLFAVADGHGLHGHYVSKFVVKNLSRLLQTALKTLDPVQSFKITFKKIQQLLQESDINAQYSGTTLISILIKNNELFCSNVGDSRAIIISSNKNNNWQISELSRDHKPCLPSEKQRILKSGGRIQSFKDQNGESIGPLRVWLANQNVQGLAMSRSIGDNISKSIGVTYQPEIFTYKLKQKDKIIVMGSDGLWEFIDNQEAASVILPYYLKGKLEDGIDALVSLAYKRWTAEDDSVVDDITVIVVFLDK